MGLFGGTKKSGAGTKPVLSAEEILIAKSPVADDDIHVMPEQYALVAPRRGLSRRTKIIIIVIGGAVIIGGGAVFFSIDWRTVENNETPAVTPSINQTPVVNQPTASISGQNNNQDTNTASEPTMPGTVVAEQPAEKLTNPPVTEEPVLPVVIVPELPVKLQLAVGRDADRDGLTDVEEVLYGTDRSKPDTDLDGYLDSEELKAGYSPLLVGKTLADDAAVKTYTGTDFSVIYPALWRVDIPEGEQTQVNFISPTTSDFIEIVVYPRVITSLERWYQEQIASGVGGTIPKTELYNSWQMMRSADQLSVYLKSPQTNAVYTLTYNPGQETELHFAATFAAMIHSLTEK